MILQIEQVLDLGKLARERILFLVLTNENIFHFAQLYKYWLGLSSRKYDFRRNIK